MKEQSVLGRFRANFFAGLAVVLPALISVGVFIWIFGTIANFTDQLLFFLPPEVTHRDAGKGTVYWYWSVVALVLAVMIVTLIGRVARHYFGRKLIEWADLALLRIPLLNKIYSTVKQVNEALSSNKSSFKQVVLVPFPNAESSSIGFITNDQRMKSPSGVELVTVFVPTTPNPTSGFLVLYPEHQITKLDIPVAEGIKFIISIGSIPPDQQKARFAELKVKG